MDEFAPKQMIKVGTTDQVLEHQRKPKRPSQKHAGGCGGSRKGREGRGVDGQCGAPLPGRGSLQKYQRTSWPSEGLLVRARYLWRAAQCLIASSSRRILDAVFRSESGDAPSASPAGATARLADVPDVDAPEDDASSPGAPPCAQLSSGPAMRAAPRGIAGDEGK